VIFIRSLVYFLFLMLSGITFGSAIVLSQRVLGFRRLSRLAQLWAISNLAVLRTVCRLNFRVFGHEHLPIGTAVVMCKHQSTWETLALRAVLSPEQTWVLKEELTRVPFFGWALKCLAPIAINRSAGLKSVKKLLVEGKRALDAGRWVVIFPEGTRVRAGERGTYNIGGALLAERTGYPVVPIAHNAGEFWGRRSFLKMPGTIDLVIGPAIGTEGKAATAISRETEEWIEGTVARLPHFESGRAKPDRKRPSTDI
jgi:1-acyl-sn-glycerol-3-phosphate acyltransferase